MEIRFLVLGTVLAAARVFGQEPPHPVLTMSSTGSDAANVYANYTESQFLQYVPVWAPRAAQYCGCVKAVVSGDTGWSWDPAQPNQLTSTPSGTVFPSGQYPIKYQAVAMLSGKTVNVPYYDATDGSKSLVFAEMAFRKREKLRADLAQLAAGYVQTGNESYARRIAVVLDAWATAVPDYYMTEKNSPTFVSATGFTTLNRDLQRASPYNGLAHEWQTKELEAFDAIYDSQALADLSAQKGYDVRAHIRNDLFYNIGDFFKDRVPYSVALSSNLSGPYTVLPAVARVLNRPDYIVWMDGYLSETIVKKIMRDGTLNEGIAYSNQYVGENLKSAKNTRD